MLQYANGFTVFRKMLEQNLLPGEIGIVMTPVQHVIWQKYNVAETLTGKYNIIAKRFPTAVYQVDQVPHNIIRGHRLLFLKRIFLRCYFIHLINVKHQ